MSFSGNQTFVVVSEPVKSGDLFFVGELMAWALCDSDETGKVHVLIGGVLPVAKNSVELKAGEKAHFDTLKKQIVAAESASTRVVGIMVRDSAAEDETATVALIQKA